MSSTKSKSKTVGTSNRPSRDAERIENTKEEDNS